MTPRPIDIILVEDDPNDVEFARRALASVGLADRLRVLRDGREALDALLPDPGAEGIARPALILLDLKLPKVSGIEVLRKLKSDPRTRAIPVVVLTSSVQDSDLRTCYDLGVNSYLQKPIAFDRFVEVVRALGLYWIELNRTPRGDAA